jgi:hypothetical protein
MIIGNMSMRIILGIVMPPKFHSGNLHRFAISSVNAAAARLQASLILSSVLKYSKLVLNVFDKSRAYAEGDLALFFSTVQYACHGSN